MGIAPMSFTFSVQALELASALNLRITVALSASVNPGILIAYSSPMLDAMPP